MQISKLKLPQKANSTCLRLTHARRKMIRIRGYVSRIVDGFVLPLKELLDILSELRYHLMLSPQLVIEPRSLIPFITSPTKFAYGYMRPDVL